MCCLVSGLTASAAAGMGILTCVHSMRGMYQQRLREVNSNRVAVTACPVYKNRTEDFFFRQVRR